MKRAMSGVAGAARDFTGFPSNAAGFLTQLKKNNRKDWFEQHRDEYEQGLLAPAKSFVMAMGDRLSGLAPDIVAVPKIGGSIFRIYRDLRFSADKTPYKTNLAILFWEGDSRLEGSGFYFSLEPPELLLGCGIYLFDSQTMSRFRDALTNPDLLAELRAILASISRGGRYEIGGRRRKRVPAGFTPSHPAADLLLYTGLYAGIQIPPPRALYSAQLVDFCFEKFERMAPLHRWLVGLSR